MFRRAFTGFTGAYKKTGIGIWRAFTGFIGAYKRAVVGLCEYWSIGYVFAPFRLDGYILTGWVVFVYGILGVFCIFRFPRYLGKTTGSVIVLLGMDKNQFVSPQLGLQRERETER